MSPRATDVARCHPKPGLVPGFVFAGQGRALYIILNVYDSRGLT